MDLNGTNVGLLIHPCFPQSLPSIQPSVHPSVRPSIRPSFHPSVRPSVRPSVHPSIHIFPFRQSFRPFIHPSISFRSVSPSALNSLKLTLNSLSFRFRRSCLHCSVCKRKGKQITAARLQCLAKNARFIKNNYGSLI
jgi:hypothetical protein